MSRAGPSARTGTTVPLCVSLATLPARVVLALTLAVLDPPPSRATLGGGRWC